MCALFSIVMSNISVKYTEILTIVDKSGFLKSTTWENIDINVLKTRNIIIIYFKREGCGGGTTIEENEKYT